MDQIVADFGHSKDPYRRWLRHTYQEGPGFLFLATRGGRPPKQPTFGLVYVGLDKSTGDGRRRI